jgi:signal peptide peptidase SppA
VLDRLTAILPDRLRPGPIIPVVRLAGAIGIGTPLRPALTMASVAEPLDRAFAVKGAPAVAIIVNSPGGSPVQSHLIHRRIRTLAAEKRIPVIAYLEDVAASGGYMIACAADEIVADPSSIVGSIGVVSSSFGFDRLIERWGIERRVHTAGARKAILDPFRPEKPEDVEHLAAIQKEVHRGFIDLVRSRRGAHLADDEDLFSGLFWTGERGRALGLVDRLDDLKGDLAARFGPKARPKLVATERGLLRRRMPGLSALAAAEGGPLVSADEAIAAAEVRSLYARYGL